MKLSFGVSVPCLCSCAPAQHVHGVGQVPHHDPEKNKQNLFVLPAPAPLLPAAVCFLVLDFVRLREALGQCSGAGAKRGKLGLHVPRFRHTPVTD